MWTSEWAPARGGRPPAWAPPLGLVIIVLGWHAASHSAYLFQEIPYLISGGLLGVALVAGGGFLFFRGRGWFLRMMVGAPAATWRVCRADAGVRRPRPRRHHRPTWRGAAAGTNGHDPDDDRPCGQRRPYSSDTGAPPGDPAREAHTRRGCAARGVRPCWASPLGGGAVERVRDRRFALSGSAPLCGWPRAVGGPPTPTATASAGAPPRHRQRRHRGGRCSSAGT